MRILVCGSRDYNDRRLLYRVVDRYLDSDDLTIIHGAAKGADSLAQMRAKRNATKEIAVPAEWDKYVKKAGYIRNKAMLDMNPCLVFCVLF